MLAARAPNLHEALERGHDQDWSHVVLDGKVVQTDRLRVKTISKKGRTIDAWYSGKTRDFGGNIQALMRPDGLPIWVFDVEPGSTHDLSAARKHVLGALAAAAARGLPTWPIPATKAQVMASTPRSSNPPTAPSSTSTPGPQHAPAVTTLPGRARLRPAHRALAHAPTDHRQPKQDRQDRQGRTRAHPLRTQLPRLLRKPQWLYVTAGSGEDEHASVLHGGHPCVEVFVLGADPTGKRQRTMREQECASRSGNSVIVAG